MNIYKESQLSNTSNTSAPPKTPFIPTFITSSLTQSTNPNEIYTTRIQGRKILLENPVRESRSKKERAEKKARRVKGKEIRKVGVIGRKEASGRGIWRLEKGMARFELFVPLHHLWMGYMSELLGLRSTPSPTTTPAPTMRDAPSSAGIHAKLLKADFHGSIITVKQSKCPSLINHSGIVIHESENAFTIVTSRDKAKLIPKQNTIFTFSVPLYSTLPPTPSPESPQPPPLDPHAPPNPERGTGGTNPQTVLDIPHLQFDLYGNQFRFRSADRASRKFKYKETIEL